ncbi:MAG: DUF2891 domain-containing protein, partial [Saprospiraceae bacterium]|nr:DUF2891 domain-containing protein [Saprospiraceae bacterium]
LTLAKELREWDQPYSRRWASYLVPLEAVAADHIRTWAPNLTYPIRIGEHSQTAFSLALYE